MSRNTLGDHGEDIENQEKEWEEDVTSPGWKKDRGNIDTKARKAENLQGPSPTDQGCF